MAFRVRETRQNLKDWLAQDPGKGKDSYSAAIGTALGNMANKAGTAKSYNAAGDANVANHRQNYRLMAQAAADNAAAGTEALSGGYGADYAASAAAQGYQQLMEGQPDYEDHLRRLARAGYEAQGGQSAALISALLGAQSLEQNANQIATSDWAAQRDFLTGEASQAQSESDNFWSNVWDGLVWAANTAMNTYDNYKGYTQQQWENEFAQKQWDAQLAQQALENERYNTEYADSRADTAWSQGITEQELAAQLQAAADDHNLSLAQLQNLRSGGGSGSSGSSGGTKDTRLSVNDLDKLLKGYQEADMFEDKTVRDQFGKRLAQEGYDVGWTDMMINGGESLARLVIKQGGTKDDIVAQLAAEGLTDDMIAEVLNRVR